MAKTNEIDSDIPRAGNTLTSELRANWAVVKSQSNNVFDVVAHYGADKTGATSAVAAFQAAHDDLPAGGGIIYAPTGTYKMEKDTKADDKTDHLLITKSNVTLMGDGWGTVLNYTTSGTVTGTQSVIIVDSSAAAVDNTIIRDLRITGPGSNTGATIPADNRVMAICLHDATDGYDITDVLIENVIGEGFEIATFGVNGSTNNGVKRCTFSKCWARYGRQDGFNDFGGKNNEVTFNNCWATDLDGFGFEIGGGGGSYKITNCTAARTGQSGIGFEFNNTTSLVTEVLIANNQVHDITTTGYPDASGISLAQAQVAQNVTIVGNTISRTGGHGIVWSGAGANNITISDNTIHDVGGGGTNDEGITTAVATTNLLIANNRIRSNTAGYQLGTGINVAGAGSATNLIANNLIQGNTAAPVIANRPTRVTQGFERLISTTTGSWTSGGGEAAMQEVTIPANYLGRDDDTIKITAYGTTAANGNNKTVKLYFGGIGGTQLITTGAIAANNKDWFIEATLTRDISTAFKSVAHGQFNNAIINVDNVTGTTQDFTGTNAITITGEATTTADIACGVLMVEFLEG